jgi:16S rRNA (cytosine967-C5)-methyltransferase
VLADVERGAWVDRVLASREERLRDGRERRFLHLLVLSTLRWLGALVAVLVRAVHGGSARLEPLVRAALRTGVLEATLLRRPRPIAVSATVDAVASVAGRRAAGLVNAVLRRVLSGGEFALDPQLTVPGWILGRWRERWDPSRLAAMLDAINRPASAFLVALGENPRRREMIASELLRDGVTTEESPFHPGGLRVLSGVPQHSACFRERRIVLLDPAAALVGLLAAAEESRPRADLAAAPGGKLSLMADVRAGRGVVALEIDAERARRLAARFESPGERAAVGVVRADARRPPLPSGAFGTVLLDAPCSGTGTMRRRPDRRWRLSERKLVRAAREQRELLDAASRLVAPGGALVYAVCSLEPEEGRQQIAAFLARQRSFRASDPRALLPPAAHHLVDPCDLVLETRPDREEMDGFVAARLERRAA